jgi:hypothetical protein
MQSLVAVPYSAVAPGEARGTRAERTYERYPQPQECAVAPPERRDGTSAYTASRHCRSRWSAVKGQKAENSLGKRCRGSDARLLAPVERHIIISMRSKVIACRKSFGPSKCRSPLFGTGATLIVSRSSPNKSWTNHNRHCNLWQVVAIMEIENGYGYPGTTG